MGIEIARSNEVASASSSGASRGKPTPVDAVGGFGAVLASMDEASVADASSTHGADSADPANGSDAKKDETSKNASTDHTADITAATAATAAATAAPPPAPADPAPAVVDPSALLLAQAALGAGRTPAPTTARETAPMQPDTPIAGIGNAGGTARADAQTALPTVPTLPTLPAVPLASAAPATPAQPSTPAENTAPEAPGLPNVSVVGKPAATPPGVAKDTGTVDSPSAALGVTLLGNAEGRKGGARDGLRATAAQDNGAAPRPTAVAGANAAAATAAADAAATARAQTPAAEAVVVLPAAAAALVGDAPTPWRRIERTSEASIGGAGALAGSDTSTASPMASSTDATTAAAAGNAVNGSGFTERLVEQVSWWMAHRSQGAELKLDMPDGAPVSVTVQVTGNEAHVAFRSDSPEARQWLGAALPQLKEMFGSEGLMLSGASVGNSGTGAEQEAARDAQRALRGGGSTAAGGGTDAATAVTPVRPRSVAERALDLYV